jgi:hypothetical protein
MTEEIIEDAPVIGTVYGDMYLRFPDEATAFESLYKPVVQTVVVLDDEGTPTYTEEVVEGEFVPRYNMSIDTIGIIYNVDNTDPENPIYTPQDGWHVNTRGAMSHMLAEYSVEAPATPRRIWA